MTREERKAAARARKDAAIARQKAKQVQAGDLPSSDESEDEDDGMPANPNHTAKAQKMAASAATATKGAPTPAAAAAAVSKGSRDESQLSRKEREALQAQRAKERYNKMHAEGKTEEARADLERLALVRERREQDAARKKAEAEEKALIDKEKKEQMERMERQAALKAKKPGAKKGGK